MSVVLAIAFLGASGCSETVKDECVRGEARCVDGVAQNCVGGGQDEPYHIVNKSCGTRQCVAPEGSFAFCAHEQSPACPATAGESEVCDGTDLLDCYGGWIVGRAKCDACKPPSDAVTFGDRCVRGLGNRCASAADCREEYTCFGAEEEGRGFCSLPCVPETDCSSGVATADGRCGCGYFTY